MSTAIFDNIVRRPERLSQISSHASWLLNVKSLQATVRLPSCLTGMHLNRVYSKILASK
jgi:hypothetical protein